MAMLNPRRHVQRFIARIVMHCSFAAVLLTGASLLLSACGTIPKVVDDGRPLKPELASHAKVVTEGYRVLAAAATQTAPLVSATGCTVTHTYPLMLFTADLFPNRDDQIALLRTGGFDERLRVLAAEPDLELAPRMVIVSLDGHTGRARDLWVRYYKAMRSGDKIRLELENHRTLVIAPITVCRNRIFLPDPSLYRVESFGLQVTVLPGDLFEVTDDVQRAEEALWMTVWVQGLSEEAWGRMATYTTVMGAIHQLGFLGDVVGAAVNAVTTSNTDAAPGHTVKRKGLNAVAASAFGDADRWAVHAMRLLGKDPSVAIRLHERLLAAGMLRNPFVLDPQRLAKLEQLLSTQDGENSVAQSPEALHAVKTARGDATN